MIETTKNILKFLPPAIFPNFEGCSNKKSFYNKIWSEILFIFPEGTTHAEKKQRYK